MSDHDNCPNNHFWLEAGPGGSAVCSDCGHRPFEKCRGCKR